jgi:hypothetical protein
MRDSRSMIDLKSIVLSGAILIAGVGPGIASAALGEMEASVTADVAQLKGSIKVTDRTSYRVHEIQLSSGTLVREFAGPDGKVFAIAWKGPTIPNLRQTLGQYFDNYVTAAKRQAHGPQSSANPTKRSRGTGGRSHARLLGTRLPAAGRAQRRQRGRFALMVKFAINGAQVRTARFGLCATLCLAALSCGGGDGAATSDGSSSGGTTSPTASNVVSVVVDAGPLPTTYPDVNTLFTTVTVCVPGSTTSCQTIDHIQVDTGSYGLRILPRC